MQHHKLEHCPLSIDCGKGWHGLVKHVLDNLSEGCYPSQIKEKFGLLRIYLRCGTDEDYALVREAEKQSATICENCGAPGEVRSLWGWLTCLCEECNK